MKGQEYLQFQWGEWTHNRNSDRYKLGEIHDFFQPWKTYFPQFLVPRKEKQNKINMLYL